ncbi:MAG: hypothetical protein Kow0092_39380 [Deferrisomatales bacterium]
MKKRSILLVDDELLIRSSVTRALEATGLSVTAVASGDEAVARLAAGPFDLVVTDLVMEGRDGVQVLEEAKRADPDICVIVLTGYCDVGSAVDALRLGADDYLSKPCDFDELLLRVERCLEKRDLRRKLRLYESLLPVCFSCNRIRDDSESGPGAGQWTALEEYVSRRAGPTGFPRSCPRCRAAARSNGAGSSG